MKKNLAIFAFLMVALSANAQERIKLFNGKNLNGWSSTTKMIGDLPDEVFTVQNKTLQAGGEYGYIYTNEQYKNYNLTFEWRWVGEGSNSGLFLNMQGENKIWPSCYEVQLRSGDAGTMYHVSGTQSDESRAKQSNKAAYHENLERPVGKWNQIEVINTGSDITVYINGELQNEIHNISQSSGHIGLQSEGAPIQFRNIELTPLTK